MSVSVGVPQSQGSFPGAGTTPALHKQHSAELRTEQIEEDDEHKVPPNDTPSFNFHGLIWVLAEQGRPPRWHVGLVVGG